MQNDYEHISCLNFTFLINKYEGSLFIDLKTRCGFLEKCLNRTVLLSIKNDQDFFAQ